MNREEVLLSSIDQLQTYCKLIDSSSEVQGGLGTKAKKLQSASEALNLSDSSICGQLDSLRRSVDEEILKDFAAQNLKRSLWLSKSQSDSDPNRQR
jgi:hypothetical protein